MATATIRIKKGTTAEWIESHRVLDDGELGLELTADGHRIIRIGNGATEFMDLPVSFDIEEVREIKTGMEDSVKTYYESMVEKGTELLAEMKAMATTVELEDDATASSTGWECPEERCILRNLRKRRSFRTPEEVQRNPEENRPTTQNRR